MVISGSMNVLCTYFGTLGSRSDDCRFLTLVLASPITQNGMPTWTTPCVMHVWSFGQIPVGDEVDDAKVLVPKSRSWDFLWFLDVSLVGLFYRSKLQAA